MLKKHFDILEIPVTRDKTVIKKAYRKLALKYHPDRNDSPDASIKFIEISDAYEAIMEGLEKNTHHHTHNTTKQYTYKDFQHASYQAPTEEEILKERIRYAKQRYEYLKKRDEEITNAYYTKINSGGYKLAFNLLVIFATSLSLLFTLDKVIAPKNFEKDIIYEGDINKVYTGVVHEQVINLITLKGHSLYIPPYEGNVMVKQPKIYLEKTFFFKDIKAVWYWDFDSWEKVKIDFNEVNTFPLFPLLLLIPLITWIIRRNSTLFFFMHFLSLYVISVVLLILLISNNRWITFFTFGLL